MKSELLLIHQTWGSWALASHIPRRCELSDKCNRGSLSDATLYAAGVWQLDYLGGRLNGREKELGKLKWGVGKIIAHSPVSFLSYIILDSTNFCDLICITWFVIDSLQKAPLVIPFFHAGYVKRPIQLNKVFHFVLAY